MNSKAIFVKETSPFLFGQKHKTLLVTIFLALMLLYVNLGLLYRVRHREERYCYIYWFA